jgi:hypothetical protein
MEIIFRSVVATASAGPVLPHSGDVNQIGQTTADFLRANPHAKCYRLGKVLRDWKFSFRFTAVPAISIRRSLREKDFETRGIRPVGSSQGDPVLPGWMLRL